MITLRALRPNDPLAVELPRRIPFVMESEYTYEVAANETAAGFTWSLIRRPASPRVSERREWVSMLASGARGVLAEVDEEPAGYVEYSQEDSLIRIHTLLVHSRHKRNGVGTKLLERVRQDSKHYRAKGIVMTIDARNVPALDFLQKCGYTFDAVKMHPDEHGTPMVGMWLSVGR